MIRLINNGEKDNMRGCLNQQLSEAHQVAFAVAFLSESGLSAILDGLDAVLRRDGKVFFITGLFQAVTDPDALWQLNALQQRYSGSVYVGISREQQFHQKFYYSDNQSLDKAILTIGSSNMTSGGLRSGGEINITIQDTPDNPIFQEAKQNFIKQKALCVPLTPMLIQRYIESRSELIRLAQRIGNNDWSVLDEVLGEKSIHNDCEDQSYINRKEELKQASREYRREQYKKAKSDISARNKEYYQANKEKYKRK